MVFLALRRLMYISGAPPVDNFTFKLCYRWTTLILVCFSIIITCRLFRGDSFACSSKEDIFSDAYINTKCYESTVYTKFVVAESKSSPFDPTVEDLRRYQSYYPWVNLVFVAHALIFYLPHLLWKSYEKGYIYRLTVGVQKFFDREEKRGLELCYLAKYVLVTQGKHKLYAGMYVFFEACNCAIALGMTFCLLHFFDVTGVPDVMIYPLETWSDFRNFYFPSEGICEFQNPVTPLRQVTTLCQLPLNRLYMQMFLFLQVWYAMLFTCCSMVLIYRVALSVPALRIFAVKFSSPLAERSVLVSVCQRLTYSDWFFLSRLQKAMTDVDFAQMVDKICVVSQGRDSQKGDQDNARFSMYEDATKEFHHFATSPV